MKSSWIFHSTDDVGWAMKDRKSRLLTKKTPQKNVITRLNCLSAEEERLKKAEDFLGSWKKRKLFKAKIRKSKVRKVEPIQI